VTCVWDGTAQTTSDSLHSLSFRLGQCTDCSALFYHWVAAVWQHLMKTKGQCTINNARTWRLCESRLVKSRHVLHCCVRLKVTLCLQSTLPGLDASVSLISLSTDMNTSKFRDQDMSSHPPPWQIPLCLQLHCLNTSPTTFPHSMS